MSEHLAVKGVAAAKMKANECFALWLSSPQGESTVATLVAEMLAASRGGAHTDPTAAPSGEVGGPPLTPPRTSFAGDGGDPTHRAAPSALSARFLGVDEVEMHRAMSPGASSPVSPNAGALRGVAPRPDPHLPRSPDAAHLAAAGPAAPLAGIPGERSGSGGGAVSPFRDKGRLATELQNQSFGRAPSPIVDRLSAHVGHQFASFDDIPKFFEPGSRVHAAPAAVAGHGVGAAGAAAAAQNPTVLEMTALSDAFSSGGRPNTAKRAGGKAGVLEIDTTRGLKRSQLGSVAADVCKVPGWMRHAVFARVLQANGLPDNGPSTLVRYSEVKKFYDARMRGLTPNRRLFELLSSDPKKQVVYLQDFVNAARMLVECHPGLSFLTQPEFQDLYCRTVGIRIVYHNERNHGRCVTWNDFDRSDVPNIMRNLDQITDINSVLTYFSYEHFYVLYCRFWELDTNKDHKVGLADLRNYNGGQLTNRVLERVVRGFGRKLSSDTHLELDYEDFVYFCLSEEDKNTTPAKRYWFGVLDLDGDGVLSGHEMEYFFEEQAGALDQLAGEEIPYQDMLCQMLDMLVPELPRKQGITISELKRCETAENFFNMLFNAAKFLQFEHRDPFAEHQAKQAPEKTAWDRFARAEYDRMAQEATNA